MEVGLIFIDVSKWNGIFDWSKAQAQGVEGVYIKATGSGNYGNYEDFKFPLNADTCTLKYKGSYHYFDYQGRSGADQCKYFLDKVGDFGNMRGVLDIEDNSANGWKPIDSVIGIAMREALAWVYQYKLDTGHYPVMYLNLGLAKQRQWTITGYKYIFRNFLDCPLWIARYGDVPDPLIYSSKERAAWSDYAMWQYTSKGNGALYGNAINNDFIDLNKVKNLNALLKPGITAEDEIIDMTNVMNIAPLSQADASRKDIAFGNTKIGYDGCLTVDIEMMLNYLGLKIDTAGLVTWLKANDGYYGNLFVWKSIEKLLPGVLFTMKYTGPNLDKIDESLSRKMPVLVHVDYDPATSLIDQHWVLVVGKSGASYIINDPRDGSRVRFEDVYGDPATHIYNVATYSFTGTITDAEKLSRLWNAHPTLH